MDVKQREDDIIYVTTAITWMNKAFEGQTGEVAKMIQDTGASFARILQSYEEEIECLKRALPADKPIPTDLLPAPVDTVEE